MRFWCGPHQTLFILHTPRLCLFFFGVVLLLVSFLFFSHSYQFGKQENVKIITNTCVITERMSILGLVRARATCIIITLAKNQ